MSGHHAPPVSIVVPARDAERTLPGALDSILAQNYDGPVEAIVADGSAGQATRALLQARYPGVRRVANPARTSPAGLNRALGAARHAVIARCDAHATLPPNYLARAVETLLRTEAVNVGGYQRSTGATPFGRAVALVTNSRLGAGDARYRIGGAEGPVDTVFLGVFRRAAIEAVGGWDETLARNEDYELNWRLRAAGGTVWFDPELTVDYLPRDTFPALARQYFGNGWWKAAVLARHPRSWRARQLVPPALVAALAVSPALPGGSGWLLPALYAAGLACASVAVAANARLSEAVWVPAVALTIHLAFGIGLLAGLPAALCARKRRQ